MKIKDFTDFIDSDVYIQAMWRCWLNNLAAAERDAAAAANAIEQARQASDLEISEADDWCLEELPPKSRKRRK